MSPVLSVGAPLQIIPALCFFLLQCNLDHFIASTKKHSSGVGGRAVSVAHSSSSALVCSVSDKTNNVVV